MKMMIFAKRCAKEILRDPLTLCFGLGFPLMILLLLHTIQSNIPAALFTLNSLAPGVAVFGLSFMTLFSATLISKDRESAFLQRLYTTPLSGIDFVLGYMLPLLPMALGQSFLCYLCAILLGLPVSIHLLFSLIGVLPMAVFHIALGLLCGSVLRVKQVSGICGALLTNLSAWLSGVWFDLNLAGDVFGFVASLLPFFHAAEWNKALLQGNAGSAVSHLFPILIYSTLTTIAAIYCFLRQMKKQ